MLSPPISADKRPVSNTRHKRYQWPNISVRFRMESRSQVQAETLELFGTGARSLRWPDEDRNRSASNRLSAGERTWPWLPLRYVKRSLLDDRKIDQPPASCDE